MRRIALVSVLGLAPIALVGQAPRAGVSPDSAWWTFPGRTSGIPAPTFEGIRRRSLYVPMRDGVRLAVDLYLPESLPAGVRLPTIIEQTRYVRSFDLGPGAPPALTRPRPDVRAFVSRGYAYLVVDVRGTGASFGGRIAEFHEKEVHDGKDVLDWIVRQPWSDGRVGAQGVSYVGSTADLLLVNRHPAVKAVAPTFAFYDTYADIAAPGGILLDFFIKSWGEAIRAMDRNEVSDRQRQAGILGTRPVDADTDRAMLRAAVAGHVDNVRVDDVVGQIQYRDDVGANGLTIDATSTHSFRREQTESGAAIYSYSGWFDGGYQHGAIKRFLTVKTPGSRLILGPWSHGGFWFWIPGMADAAPSSFDRLGELVRFFDHQLKGTSTGIEREPVIHYFTMGENVWKTSPTWPVPGTTNQTWYFAGDGALATDRPAAAVGADRYTVDTTVGTGPTSRWNTLLGGGPAAYPDRADLDRRLLTYTSGPLPRPLVVTGQPLVTLHLTSSATDGEFFVYLEEVSPEGRVGYVTEGVLRASLRRIAPDRAPYRQVPPYHPLTKASAEPLVPGAPFDLVFDLLPTSYQFPAGSRIRIAVAGADRDHFARIPAGATPTITMYRTTARPSHVVLPVVPPRRPPPGAH
jgi:uncharacterized protein